MAGFGQSQKEMATLGASFDLSCDLSMMWLMGVLWAQPTSDHTGSVIEYTKTKDGRDLYWMEDHRHRIVQIRVQFDSGVGECASVIQRAWKRRHRLMDKRLLNMGGYARFWMGENTSFVEVSVFEHHEQEGFRWIRSFVNRIQILDSDVRLRSPVRDIVTDMLYEQRELPIDKEACSNRYQDWKKSHTPRFLISGATRVHEVLPFLHFFWPASVASQYRHVSNKRKERSIYKHLIVDDDLGAQVEVSLLIVLPKTEQKHLHAYRHILDGGFGGRLMTRLREKRGWVYDVQTKVHYGTRKRLEISMQCNVEDLLAVRDEIPLIIEEMKHVLPEEMERYRWSQIHEYRERLFFGMPHLVASIQNRDQIQDIPSKESVEELATKINMDEIVWILRGRKNNIANIWPADWSHISLED